MKHFLLLSLTALIGVFFWGGIARAQSPASVSLWTTYEQSLKSAKYVDLTHTITPSIPIWHGFAQPRFSATVDPQTQKAYSYELDGFEATHYDLPTDQLGTQLDAPAHWNPYCLLYTSPSPRDQ